jgi:hypothetical protein
MRIMTYYLETGREVDIHFNGDDTFDDIFTAVDAFHNVEWEFGKHYPTWNDVSAKWIELSGGKNDN